MTQESGSSIAVENFGHATMSALESQSLLAAARDLMGQKEYAAASVKRDEAQVRATLALTYATLAGTAEQTLEISRLTYRLGELSSAIRVQGN